MYSKYRGMAGNDEERVSALHNMFLDKSIKAIIALRGGFGAIRLVDKIDYSIIKNNPKIFCGYSDIIGLMYLSAGAEVITTGWSQKSRFFCRGNYKEMSGGSLPRPRYMSIPLLNSININPELDQIKNFGLIEKVLSGTEYDEFVIQTPVADNWSQVSFYHHLNCLDLCVEDILLYEVDKRLEIMQTKIGRAIEIYNELELLGVPFAQHTNNTHLCQWQTALNSLKEMIQ